MDKKKQYRTPEFKVCLYTVTTAIMDWPSSTDPDPWNGLDDSTNMDASLLNDRC